jgi:hypothetical protein
MGKVRSGSHLLEAFRAGERREGQPLLIQPPPRPAQVAAAPPPARELSLGDPACLVVRFSATVLATVVLVGVVLLVGAFLLGRASAGRAVAEVKATLAPAPATQAERRAALPAAVLAQTPATPPEATSSQPAVFAVQVAVYGPGKANLAEDLATFLRSRGVPAVEVKPVDKQYYVLAGKFPAANDPVAQRLLQDIKQLRYENSDFRSAYVVRVP